MGVCLHVCVSLVTTLCVSAEHGSLPRCNQRQINTYTLRVGHPASQWDLSSSPFQKYQKFFLLLPPHHSQKHKVQYRCHNTESTIHGEANCSTNPWSNLVNHSQDSISFILGSVCSLAWVQMTFNLKCTFALPYSFVEVVFSEENIYILVLVDFL